MRPLRVGLNMSRAHYEMELQRTMDGQKGKVKGEGRDPAMMILPLLYNMSLFVERFDGLETASILCFE